MIYQLHTCKEGMFRYFLQPPPWQKYYSCHHCSTPNTYRNRDGRRATDHDALRSELPLKEQYLCHHCSTTTMYRYRDGRGATDHDALRSELPLTKQNLCRHCSTKTMYRYRDGRGATDHDALRSERRFPASRAVWMSTAPKVISNPTCIFNLFQVVYLVTTIVLK